jgi:MFS family permease
MNIKLKKIITSNLFICGILFVLSLGVYLSNLRYIGVTDTTTNERFAYNFAKTGKLYLNEKVEFTNLLAEDDFPSEITNTHEVDGKFYSKYPPALSILSYPFFKSAQIVGLNNTNLIGKFTGAFLTALSIPLLYLALSKITRRKVSLIITIIYAFASSAWGVTSQALWQHTFSQLISISIIYLILNLLTLSNKEKCKVLIFKIGQAKIKIISYFLIGFLLSLNITVRPTNIIAAALIGLLILSGRNKKYILASILGGSIPLVFLVIYNLSAFGSVLSSGYGAESSWGWSAPFFQGFLGLILSPSVGLLVFSPIFIFALIGAFKILLDNLKNIRLGLSKENFFTISILIFLLNWIVYSKWWAWHGDSWVYRMLLDGLPYLLLGFIYPFERILSNISKNRVGLCLVFITLTFSIYTQLLGAFSYDYAWDSRYKVSWKDYSYLFSIPKSRIAYYLDNQKYYVNFPHKSVYVLNDHFGNKFDFDGENLNLSGEKIVHAAFLSSGRSPFIKDNTLHIDTKYDGLSFYVNDNYLSRNLEIKINIDLENSDKESVLQVRQIGGKEDGAIEKLRIKEEIIVKVKGSQEIRIQNDEISDKISIKNIEIKATE